MSPISRFALGVLWVALAATGTLAQVTAEATVPTPSSDFSKEPYVIEMMHTRTRYEANGLSSRELVAQVKIQSETALRQFGLLRMAYASKFETANLEYVRVRKPSGELIETPTAEAQDVDSEVSREAPMYTDQREKHLAVKALAVGDILEYRVTWKGHDVLAPGHFWMDDNFVKGAVSLDEQIEIDVPRDVPVKLLSGRVTPVVKEKDDRRIYTLEQASFKGYEPETEGVWEKGVGKAEPAEVRLTSFVSWEQVGKWIEGLTTPQQEVTPEIRAKAEEITKGKTSEEEKVRALYEFVSLNFRYIGISMGLSRYRPHKAAEVLANRYGDCKDKHTLFAALLAAEGIKAYPALISTGVKIDDKFPTPGEFDHMITAIPKGDGFEFLDTTAEIGKFGYLVAALRNKSALVVVNGGSARLVKTTANPPGANGETFRAEAALDGNGTLESKSRWDTGGDYEFGIRSVFRGTSESQWTELVQQICRNLGFGGTVSEVAVARPEALGEPFWFSYSYHREDYSDWKERQITLPLPPLVLPDLAEKRKNLAEPVVLGSPTEMTFEAEVKLPKGMTPELPKDIDLASDFAAYSAKYTFKDGVLKGRRHLQVLQAEIPGMERPKYSTFVKALVDDQNSYIPLREGEESDPVGSHPANDTEDLYRQAYQSLQAGVPAQAILNLERAVKLDPEFFNGWWLLGSARITAGQTDAGIEAFQKAVSLQPSNVMVRQRFATALTMVQHQDEAIAQWREVLKLSPGDVKAAEGIGRVLVYTKRYKEAATFLVEQEKAGNSSAEMELQLGKAYMASGEAEKGMEQFHKAIESQRTSGALNAAAYAMAEANYELPEALAYAKECVEKIEQESTETTAGDLREPWTTVSLAAEWDTLGWVKFRMGDLGGAQKYLEAAWRLMQSPEGGEHVGELYEKIGKKQQALEQYSMALNALGLKGDGDLRQRLTEKIATLKAGGATKKGDAGGELSALRSYKLELPKGWSGYGMGAVRLELVNGAPVRVSASFVSGSEELRKYAPTLEKANFRIVFPDERAAKIAVMGTLSCSEASRACTLVLQPVGEPWTRPAVPSPATPAS